MRNPIIHLVEKRRRAQYGRFFIESAGLMTAYLVLVVLAGGVTAYEHQVYTLAWSLLLVVPLVASLPTARFFASLQQDRVLDDLLITTLSPASIIDGIAWSSVRSVLPAGGVGFLGLLLGAVLTHAMAVGLWLWFPALIGLTLTTTYLVLDRQRGFNPLQSLRFWAVPLLLALQIYLSLAAVPGLLRNATPAVALVILGWRARRGSIWALLASPDTRDRSVFRSVSPLPLRVTHAIVMRETASQAHRTPGGFWAWLMGQMLLMPLTCLLASLVLKPVLLGPTLVVALFVLQPLRAAWRSGIALVTEKDARTLELLHQSSMRAEEFVDGWALAAATGPLLECLMVWPLLGYSLGSAPAGRVTVDLLLLVFVCGYLGVMMSSVAPSRTIARRFLHVWTALYVGFGVLPVALAAFLSGRSTDMGPWQWALPLLGFVVMMLFRTWALNRVQDDQYLIGFGR